MAPERRHLDPRLAKDLATLKKDVRSVVLSVKGGLSPACLERDYQELFGKPLPLREFGFTSGLDLARNLSDTLSVHPNSSTPGGFLLFPIADENTAHLLELVRNQRSSAPSRKHHGRGGGLCGALLGNNVAMASGSRAWRPRLSPPARVLQAPPVQHRAMGVPRPSTFHHQARAVHRLPVPLRQAFAPPRSLVPKQLTLKEEPLSGHRQEPPPARAPSSGLSPRPVADGPTKDALEWPVNETETLQRVGLPKRAASSQQPFPGSPRSDWIDMDVRKSRNTRRNTSGLPPDEPKRRHPLDRVLYNVPLESPKERPTLGSGMVADTIAPARLKRQRSGLRGDSSNIERSHGASAEVMHVVQSAPVQLNQAFIKQEKARLLKVYCRPVPAVCHVLRAVQENKPSCEMDSPAEDSCPEWLPRVSKLLKKPFQKRALEEVYYAQFGERLVSGWTKLLDPKEFIVKNSFGVDFVFKRPSPCPP